MKGDGVDYPCFGEYQCPNCDRVWESSKAWRDYGQQCKTCATVVSATGLQTLFHYICKPCYARTEGKEGHWKYKLCKDGRKCRSCGENVIPFLTYSEYVSARKLWVTGPNHTDPEISHQQGLCEKCTKLGRLCYGSATSMKPVSDEKNEHVTLEPLSQNRQNKYGNARSVSAPESQGVGQNDSFVSTYTRGNVKPGLSYTKVTTGISTGISASATSSSSSSSGNDRYSVAPRNTATVNRSSQGSNLNRFSAEETLGATIATGTRGSTTTNPYVVGTPERLRGNRTGRPYALKTNPGPVNSVLDYCSIC